MQPQSAPKSEKSELLTLDPSVPWHEYLIDLHACGASMDYLTALVAELTPDQRAHLENCAPDPDRGSLQCSRCASILQTAENQATARPRLVDDLLNVVTTKDRAAAEVVVSEALGKHGHSVEDVVDVIEAVGRFPRRAKHPAQVAATLRKRRERDRVRA
ncbi:MAG: hypothetical protein ACRDK3_00500 [Actinomycetota bacterium]